MNKATNKADNYKRLWAKSEPKHPLWKHLLDTAAISMSLPPLKIDSGWGERELAFLVGLHDIGKADSYFQYQAPVFSEEDKEVFANTADTPCRHERISARFIKNKLTELGMDEFVVDTISRSILAHHGYWHEDAPDRSEVYQNAQRDLYDMLMAVLEVNKLPNSVSINLSAFGMLLAGHIVICDWIASNENYFTDQQLQGKDDPQEYFRETLEVAKKWVTNLGLDGNRDIGQENSIIEDARPIQKALLKTNIPPSLVIIEAPMGEGKTEAAWILAEKWRSQGYNGIYMALPTMATSDSLYLRYIRDYLKKTGRGETAKLVHGMAWLRDEQETEIQLKVGENEDDQALATAWFRPTRRAMLARHGVGTIDQAMLAGMNVKFGFLRLYGLSGRVLVIDELHAYDAYMSAIIVRLLNWCSSLNIPVIVLSATLSAQQRANIIEAYGSTGDPGTDAPYPLITIAKPEKEILTIPAKSSSSRTLSIEKYPGLLNDSNAIAKLAENLIKKGGVCCVILNTVKQAQDVYSAIRLSVEEKLLFHSRFKASDREEITEKVLSFFGKRSTERPSKFILVATQVVEQSLDVDFDHMISAIAPIDLLLQRSGRMHRHYKRSYNPTLHVLLPDTESLDFGGTGKVYATKPLLRTLAILSEINEIHLPQDFRMLIERCYGTATWEQQAVSWEPIKKADKEWEEDKALLSAQARQFSLCAPKNRMFLPVNNEPVGDDSDDGNGWRAKTRLGASDYTTILVKEEEIEQLSHGVLPMEEVRKRYQESLKLPGYIPLQNPSQGYKPAVKAEGRLRGVILLPLENNGYWQAADERNNHFDITYNKELGIIIRRWQ